MPRSGEARRWEHARGREHASMRPGQSCPGVGRRRRRGANAPGLASMRPGQSCPGVGNLDGRQRSAMACFNEAGAIMPRSGSVSIAPRGVALEVLQ